MYTCIQFSFIPIGEGYRRHEYMSNIQCRIKRIKTNSLIGVGYSICSTYGLCTLLSAVMMFQPPTAVEVVVCPIHCQVFNVKEMDVKVLRRFQQWHFRFFVTVSAILL